MTARRTNFGLHPDPLTFQAGPIIIEPLPDLTAKLAGIGEERVEGDWIYAPL